jgi:hypothetical protein
MSLDNGLRSITCMYRLVFPLKIDSYYVINVIDYWSSLTEIPAGLSVA